MLCSECPTSKLGSVRKCRLPRGVADLVEHQYLGEEDSGLGFPLLETQFLGFVNLRLQGLCVTNCGCTTAVSVEEAYKLSKALFV